MMRVSRTYKERRSLGPKRIRLTRDKSLCDGIELAKRVREQETGKKQTLESLLPEALNGLSAQTGAFAKSLLLTLDLSRDAEKGSVWISAEQIAQCDQIAMHLYVTGERRKPGQPPGRNFWASRRCIVIAAFFTYCIDVGNRTKLIN